MRWNRNIQREAGKFMWEVSQISTIVNGTLTKEDFEIIKCIENNTPFTMLLGKPWIERDQTRWKQEEEASKKKKKS
jgi:hypothetical protein